MIWPNNIWRPTSTTQEVEGPLTELLNTSSAVPRPHSLRSAARRILRSTRSLLLVISKPSLIMRHVSGNTTLDQFPTQKPSLARVS